MQTVTVTYDVGGDTNTAVHKAPRVTYRLRGSGVGTVREFDVDNSEVRSVSYRSVWTVERVVGGHPLQ